MLRFSIFLSFFGMLLEKSTTSSYQILKSKLQKKQSSKPGNIYDLIQWENIDLLSWHGILTKTLVKFIIVCEKKNKKKKFPKKTKQKINQTKKNQSSTVLIPSLSANVVNSVTLWEPSRVLIEQKPCSWQTEVNDGKDIIHSFEEFTWWFNCCSVAVFPWLSFLGLFYILQCFFSWE